MTPNIARRKIACSRQWPDRRILLGWPLSLLLSGTKIAAAPASPKAPPSTVLADAYTALNGAIGKGQQQVDIVAAQLARVDLDAATTDAEKFSLAELYFIGVRPKESLDLFSGFLDRDDLLGRKAWERAMMIRFRAYGKTDEVAAEFPEFKKRFPYVPYDSEQTAGYVFNFVDLYSTTGREKLALDLIAAEVKGAPFDGPYSVHAFPASRFELFQELGRADEARALAKSSRDGLAAVLAARLRRGPTRQEEAELPAPSSVARWYRLTQGQSAGQSVFDSRNALYRRLIDRLDKRV